MEERDYVNMSLYDALNLAVKLSPYPTKEEAGAALGYEPGTADRIFGAGNYWPSLPNIPRFCAVLGNNVLIEWLFAQARAGGVKHEFPAMDCTTLLMGMNKLIRDLGDVARECERAVALQPGEQVPILEAAEASRLIKRLLNLCSDSVHTIRGLRPIVVRGCGAGDE